MSFFNPTIIYNILSIETLNQEDSDNFIIDINFLKGKPKIYMTYCSQFPFNWKNESNNLKKENLFYSVQANDIGVFYKDNKYPFLYSIIYPNYNI